VPCHGAALEVATAALMLAAFTSLGIASSLPAAGRRVICGLNRFK